MFPVPHKERYSSTSNRKFSDRNLAILYLDFRLYKKRPSPTDSQLKLFSLIKNSDEQNCSIFGVFGVLTNYSRYAMLSLLAYSFNRHGRDVVLAIISTVRPLTELLHSSTHDATTAAAICTPKNCLNLFNNTVIIYCIFY